ncbi:MAG TPA: hypothetical protein VIM70_00420 [Clostridium sp.]|uniref:hypothetical protein n=1 Tax=Clostridium sp. TaxID=1506 RepID=UPI002F935073
MWQELKRISSLAETEIGEHIDKDSRIKGFSIEGMKIGIKDEKIRVEYNEISWNFTREEFDRKPRDVMGRIFNLRRNVCN